MSAAQKSTKKAAVKKLVRVPVTGKAVRVLSDGQTFELELKSFTVNGEELDPVEAAQDLARVLIWVINQGSKGNVYPNS